MKNKKLELIMVALLVKSFLFTSAFGLSIEANNESSENQLIINKIGIEPKYMTTNTKTLDYSKFKILNSNETNYSFNGIHPAFGRAEEGLILSAYYDNEIENIIWTFSTDDGINFNPGLYWEEGGDYPTIKQWEEYTFFGTFVTNYQNLNDGVTYLFDTTDPTDFDTYRLRFWDWSSFGWYDMIDADIACDSSQNSHEWGISTYVISTTYNEGYTHGPTLIFSDEEDEGSGWISWYNFNGCKHCDIDIDPVTHIGYAVYDWEDVNDSMWKLLLRKIDFTEIETGYDEIFIIEGTGNLTKPAIAAYNDHILILAETDENNNQDIICLHTDDGNPNNLISNLAASSIQNELFPDIRSDKDGNFIATYVEMNNLYAMKTENNGTDWKFIFRSPINDNLNSVIHEYKTSDLCEYGDKVLWEESIDNPEIWIGQITSRANNPPYKPIISGPNYLRRVFTKEFFISTIDPEVDNIYYFVDWGDGITSSWMGPFNSGEKITISHTWDKRGTYNIRAKAKDIHNDESEWSELEVSIPRNRALFKSYIFNWFEQFPIIQRFLQLLINYIN